MSIDLRARLERARPGGTNPATPMRGRAGVRGRARQIAFELQLLLINIRKVGTKKCGAFFGEKHKNGV